MRDSCNSDPVHYNFGAIVYTNAYCSATAMKTCRHSSRMTCCSWSSGGLPLMTMYTQYVVLMQTIRLDAYFTIELVVIEPS
jgi:hypothetical protein